MAQQQKVLLAQFDNVNSIPRTHKAERPYFYILNSDFHMQAVTNMQPHTNTLSHRCMYMFMHKYIKKTWIWWCSQNAIPVEE